MISRARCDWTLGRMWPMGLGFDTCALKGQITPNKTETDF